MRSALYICECILYSTWTCLTFVQNRFFPWTAFRAAERMFPQWDNGWLSEWPCFDAFGASSLCLNAQSANVADLGQHFRLGTTSILCGGEDCVISGTYLAKSGHFNLFWTVVIPFLDGTTSNSFSQSPTSFYKTLLLSRENTIAEQTNFVHLFLTKSCVDVFEFDLRY